MILITGFEPFGKDTENPSRLAAAQAVKHLTTAGEAASFLEVPVVFATAGKTILSEIRRLNHAHAKRVEAVICCGVANSRKCVSLESTAYNTEIGTTLPDNAGATPGGTPVVPSEPSGKARKTHLPIHRALRRIEAMGIPVEISHNAGRYVCNSVMYTILAGEGLEGVPVGFVHVPNLEAVSLEQQAEAIEIVAREALRVARGEVPWEEEKEGLVLQNGQNGFAKVDIAAIPDKIGEAAIVP